MKRFLFVDGSNLYGGQYDLFGPDKYLDFSLFVSEVERVLRVKFNKIYFYASYSPKPKRLTKKVKDYLRNEALFYRSVRKCSDLRFYKGHRSRTSGKEKGVDVAMASDIVRFSCEKKFDTAFVVTGDADFKHSLDIALEKKRKIILLTIENRIPYRLSLMYECVVFWFKKKPRFNNKNRIKLLRGRMVLIRKI